MINKLAEMTTMNDERCDARKRTRRLAAPASEIWMDFYRLWSGRTSVAVGIAY